MIDSILENLIEALPILVKVTQGYATVTKSNGERIVTIDPEGKEVPEWEGVIFPLAEQAYRQNQTLFGPSQIVPKAYSWALPIGEFVLSASNVHYAQLEKDLFNGVQHALPLIARLVGGEAVLFNKDGIRLLTYDSKGNRKTDSDGLKSKDAYEAMKIHKPIIGQSNSVSGAIALRLPITKEFGIGLNDESRVEQKQKLYNEVKKFQVTKYNFDDIIGNSSALKQVKDLAMNISKGMSSVLLFGETGTGKELFAQSIHNYSDRRTCPFVAINCGALPASLIESNLFGYEKGAFTGANKEGYKGAFEQANGGTVFLDEISELEIGLQAKLLRVLQEREVLRIGGTLPIPIDVRIIASSNKDLMQLCQKKEFRQDLYYRINVLNLVIPPLNRRKKDIPELTKHFIIKYNQLFGLYVTSTSSEAMKILLRYPWPGNIRELQNCIEYAMNLMKPSEHEIVVSKLPINLKYSNAHNLQIEKSIRNSDTLKDFMRQTEKKFINQVLLEVDHQKVLAAKVLGISTTTLWRRMKELEIT